MVSLWFPWQLIFVSGHHGEHEEGPRCQHFEKKYLGAVHCWYKHLTLTTDAAVIIVTFGRGVDCHFCMSPKQKQVYSFWFPLKKSHLYFFIASIMDQPNFFLAFSMLKGDFPEEDSSPQTSPKQPWFSGVLRHHWRSSNL